MNYLKRANELLNETIANRRILHQNAEVGLHLPRTLEFVSQKLTAYGLQPEPCGNGLTATLGKKGKTVLLRADMDALPMEEQSGEEFASPSRSAAHCCGHDLHTSMLLTAARMLRENESNLEGTVKFMFQPAEEIFEGAREMIEAGVLNNPKVDVALAYHVAAGKIPLGIYMYNDNSTMMFSADVFRICIKGKGGHGAYPHLTADPINVGVHIHLALQELIAREADPAHACIITIGKFAAGDAPNTIPDMAILEGTIRCNDEKDRQYLLKRLEEVVFSCAQTYRATTEVKLISCVPPLTCDPEFTREIISYMNSSGIPGLIPYPDITASASEDFAYIAEKVPSAFMYLSAGFSDERGDYPAHHPKVRFNEEVCLHGSVLLAHCATEWLKNNK